MILFLLLFDKNLTLLTHYDNSIHRTFQYFLSKGNARKQTQAMVVFVHFPQEPIYKSDGFASVCCPEMEILKGSMNTIIVCEPNNERLFRTKNVGKNEA